MIDSMRSQGPASRSQGAPSHLQELVQQGAADGGGVAGGAAIALLQHRLALAAQRAGDASACSQQSRHHLTQLQARVSEALSRMTQDSHQSRADGGSLNLRCCSGLLDAAAESG